MPPAGLEPTAPGLGILCSIQLSYGGLCNISYLQLYFFPPVSICAKPCLSILDEPFKIAHAVLFLRFQEMRIDSHGNRHVRVSKIPRHFRYRPSEQDEHRRVGMSEPMHAHGLVNLRLF